MKVYYKKISHIIEGKDSKIYGGYIKIEADGWQISMAKGATELKRLTVFTDGKSTIKSINPRYAKFQFSGNAVVIEHNG